MKLIRGALSGAVALAIAATPSLAFANSASKLSLSRANSSAIGSSELDGPSIPHEIAVGLIATGIVVAVILATHDPKPDSP